MSKKYVIKRKYKLKKKYKMRLLFFLGMMFMIYISGLFYFSQRFLMQTTINHINVSGLTYKQALQKIKKENQNLSIHLTFIDHQTEILKADQCGIEYYYQDDTQSLLNQQNQWLWFINYIKPTHLEYDYALKINDQKLQSSIQNLKHLSQKNQIPPSNAKVEYKNNQFIIIKENKGTTIHKKIFKKIIIDAFKKGKKEIDLYKEGSYILPLITENDKDLNHFFSACQQYADVSITYQTTSLNVVLDGNTIKDWLSIDENGKYYRDKKEFKKHTTDFVSNLAKVVNNQGIKRTYQLADDKTVTVSGGNYGLKLNKKKETEALLQDIYQLKKKKRIPITTGIQVSDSNQGLGYTFIEIDLNKQHVYYVKDHKIIWESDCVTGKYTDAKRRTPKGTYYIYFMQRNRTLRGTRNPDGSWPYESFVSYWMAFNQGIGLHDASWRDDFGGNIYYHNGSHGCINLPTSQAKKLYHLIKENTPVVVH